MVTAEDDKQLQKVEQFEAGEETGSEIKEATEETNKRVIQSNKNHDTLDVIGTSSPMATNEEANLNVEGYRTLKDESILDQNVEVISNQQASFKEIPQSIEKEMKGAQKYEAGETKVDKSSYAESSEQVISTIEATVGQNDKASVHTPVLTVESSNTNVETVTDPCTKSETIDKSSTTATILFQEELGETNLEGVENKEHESYSDLVAEEKGTEAIRPSEEIGNEKVEKDNVTCDSIEDASFSTEAERPDSQNDKEAALDIGDGAEDKLEGSSVTLPKYTASQQEDGPKVEEKTKEAASIECEEKNQETTELNKQEKYMTPVEDEMQNNNRSDTPFVREEMHLQEVDNSDIFKLDPKIGVENIVIDSTKEVMNQAESYKKIAQADGSASESNKDVENYGKKPNAFSMACEEGMQSKGEDLDRAEASAGENRDNEGFTAIVNEDNINKTELIEAIEHSKLASTEHGGSPELSLLQQHEPEKEKPERPLNVISEEIETAVSRENVEFENPEDGSKEKRKDDKPTATYDIIGHEIPGQKNLPLIDANEKTKSAEDEIPNNNANDLHVRHLLDEETGQVEGERTDEQIRKSDATSVHEKKQVANASEAYKSTISEHTSTEGTVRMEMIAKTRENIKELETVYGLDSGEKIEDKFAEANMPEVTNKEAAIDTEIHRITTKSNDTEEGLLEDDTTKFYSTVHTGDEAAKIQVESLKEAASNFSGEDEKKIEEEAHDGHKIQGSGDADKEKIEEAKVTFVTPKVIEKETKNYQDNEKEMKMSREEDDSLEIIKEGNVNDLSRKSTGEGPVQIFEDNNKEAKKSTGEIFEELQTARTGESLAHEKIHDVESSGKIPYGSLVKQEEGLWQEAEHLASAKDGDEDTSSIQVAEDNNDNNRLAEATENSAKVTLQGEEDSEQGLEINESGENIVVESPENTLHTSLVKQKEGLKGGGEDLDSTEGSIESRDEETSFIKVAEDNGKNNRPAETTESSVKVVPKVEDSDHVLQNNEPGEKNHEGESPGEILDTVKPREGLQGDIENQAPAEASTEKRDVDTSSVKVPEDNIDNNRLAEATENSAKARPEGKEISEDTLQKDEPGEIIARETNHGAESPENCPDHPLVKQVEGLQGECKKPAPTEAAIEKRDDDVSCVEVAGDNDNIDGVAETTENSTKVTPEGGEDSEKVQQIDKPGQNIVGVTNHNVDSPENNLDISLVKQEEGIQGEDDNLAPTKTSIENTDEDTFPVKVDEDNDNNNKQVETTENSVKITPKGEEDSEQLLQKDDPQENPVQGRNHEVESPEEVLDNSLVNQEEDLQGKGENLAPTEASIENKDEDGSPAIVAEHKDDTNGGDEARENSAKGEPKGEEDSEDILQKDAVGEGIACEADPELESPEKTLNTPPVKQEEGLQGEDENPIPTEASIEKRDEDTCSIKMVEGNDENNRLAEPAENSAKVTAKGEEDLEQVFQKDEPREQIEVSEEEIKEETLRQEENIDDSHSASVIVVSEEVGLREAEPENNEQVESFDNQENSKDQVKGTNLEFVEHIETIDLTEETKSGTLQDCTESNRDFNALTITNEPEVSEEDIKEEPWSQKESIINDSYSASATAVSEEAGLKEAEPENNEQIKSFDYKEIPEEDQESKGSDTAASSTNAEKLNTEKPANEDLSSSVGEVSAKEILKEDKSEATKLKEEVKGIDLGFVEQIEAMDLTEETKSGTLQVCAEPNRDFDALTITNVPQVSEEKIKEETLSQEENIIYDSYFASATDVSEEAGLKEAKPENNEQITRIDYKEISEEDQESRESETTASSTNAEKLNTEKPANEDLSSSIGEVSTKEILKEDEGDATKLKEEVKGTDLEFAEQIQAIDLTKETKSGTLQDCVERNRDFDALTITNVPEVFEEEIKEETLSQEESIINDSNSASATVVCEEAALKEVEPENNVQIKSFDYKEISEEDQESRESETAASSTNAEKLNTEKPTSEDLSSSVEEVSAKEIIKEDKSDAMKLKEEVKGTDLEFVEQIQAKDLTEETKSGTLQDCTEQNRDFNSLTITNVPEVSEEEIKEETLSQEEGIINDSYSASATVVSEEAGLKEAEPENNEQMKSFDYKEISEEDQESRGSETAASSTNPEKVNTEKPANADLSSSVGEVSAKEILKQDESDATKLKEEVKSTNLEFIEQIEATDLIEETKSETLQVCAEPNRDFNALTITNVPELSEEEIKEDTLSHEESTINDSYSTFATVVSEEAGLKEVEPENNEQIKSFDYKEISEEDQESRESATVASSTNAEKLNTEKPASEDLSSSVEEVSAKEIIKEDESDATKLKEEVKGTDLESLEQIQAIDLIEETKSGTLQDCAERNRDFNSLTITNVPEVSEEESKEETLSQEEGIINDSYSASTTVESEEAGLKEAEPENNEQMKSFDYKEIFEEDQESRGSETAASSTNPKKLNTEKPASEDLSSSVGEVSAKEILKEDESDAMKLKEEVKGTNLEFIEQIEATDLTEETKSRTLQDRAEPNKDFSALTITNASEEEIKEETLSPKESIINDSYSASATVVSEEASLKEAEPVNNEQVQSSDNKETSKEDQKFKGSQTIVSNKSNTEKPSNEDFSSSIGEVSEKESLKEDKSEDTALKEEVKGTNLEFIEQIETIDLTEETKSGTLQDYAEPEKDFSALTIANVPDVSEEKIKEETLSQEENIINDSYSASATVVSEEAGMKEAEPENNEQIKSFENKEIYEEDQESRELETAASSTNAEELNAKKPSNEDLSSSVGEVSAKEILKEDESDATKLKEEVKGTNLEFIEQIEAIDLTEETKSGTLPDRAKSNKDFSALTIPKVPEVSEEEIKEESLKQEEKIINDFDSTSVIVVSEKASLKEAELENNDQVKSSDSSPDGKDLATIETEGTSLESVNIDVKPKEYFNSEVNKDNDILPLVDEGGEKLEHQMEDKAPARVIDNEIELTTGETPLRDEITHENVKSPSSVQKTDEKSTQKGDESIKSKDLTELLSPDDGKEGAIEEVQEHKDTKLHMALELHNEKNSNDTKDEEISKSRETGELAGQTEVCNLETEKDENPSHEALKTVAVGTCKISEKAILEQEYSVQNFVESLTGVVVEKGTADLAAGAGSHECEPTNSKGNKLLVEKNLESADLGQKLDFVSESVSKDQSDETFPQTSKGQTKESSNDVQDWNSKFVERQIIGQVQHEMERKMAMQPKLEAEDQINVSQYAKETITNVIATEEVHEGVEKVDGSESIKEHAIHGESDLTEIHTVSAGDEILEKVKDSGPESTENLKATDFNEQTATLNTGIEEDPTREEEAPGTKAPEEEKIQDEGSLKPTDEDIKEKIKEEIKVQVDDFHDKNDSATVVAAESSSGEAQMDDKHVKDTSSDESLETIKTDQCPQAEEVGSKKPEKTSSSLVSQLPNMDHKNVEKESVTLDEPNADEVEETKTVFQSKYHGVEETDKTGQSLRVEKLDADGTEEAIKEASGTVSESKFLGIEAVTEDEITADQTLPTGKLEEQFQTPSSELLSLEQEHGPTIIVKETEAIKTREGEMLDDKKIDDSSATKATEDMCLQKEEQLQTLSSTLLSREQEHGTTTAFEKTEGESTREADDKNINNSSAIKATEETCLEQEEPRELNVSKLGIEINKEIQMDSSNKLNKEECCTSDGATKLGTEENEERKYSHALSESEKTGELTRQIEERSNISFEISEKAFEPVLDVHSHEVLISSEEKVQDEGIVKLVDVSTTVAEESLENIKEEIIVEVDNSCDKTENATAEMVTAESSSGEPQLHNMSTKDIISHERCQETIIMESSPLAEEVASMTLKGTSSNLPSQLPNMISENAEKEGETLESPDAHEVEETETTSDSVFESKCQSVKETDETRQSLKVEKLDAADIEDVKETSETLSKPKALEVEAVSEDGVIADQTLPAGMLSEQLQSLSSSILSKEQEHGTTTAIERTEQESTKEVQTLGTESIHDSSAAKTTEGTCFKKEELREFEVPAVGLESGKAIPRDISNVVRKEESITMDQASKLEPQEKEEIKYADSPSESEEIKELTRPIEEASNHNFEISEKASDHVSEVQSHEVLTKSEDISEKHLEAVVINLKTEESQCKKTAEANQKSKNEVSIEGVPEDKEVSMDSKSVYTGEETTIESHQGDESKTEEYLAEDTNKTFKATTNVNQHEVFRLSEIIDKGSASESIEKKITAEDRTVEDDNAAESYPDEAKGKNVEEAAIKLELEHQSGETNLMKGTPEVITPGEKEAGVEISQGGGTTGFSEVNEINQNIQQLGMTSYAASQTKISEAGPSESTEPKISTGHEDVPPVLQHPIDETLQKVETEHTRPVKAREIDAEVRGVECQGEKRMVDSGEKITEESAKFSLSDLMQKSMKENPQVAKDLTKERHPMPSKAEMQNEEAETTQFGKAKTDEEEGDEHKRTDPDSDAPVMVEASKDIDVKVAHKKSHNILSGVGSKVKHSISRVKKAITGKSSHPKTQSPK